MVTGKHKRVVLSVVVKAEFTNIVERGCSLMAIAIKGKNHWCDWAWKLYSLRHSPPSMAPVCATGRKRAFNVPSVVWTFQLSEQIFCHFPAGVWITQSWTVMVFLVLRYFCIYIYVNEMFYWWLGLGRLGCCACSIAGWQAYLGVL